MHACICLPWIPWFHILKLIGLYIPVITDIDSIAITEVTHGKHIACNLTKDTQTIFQSNLQSFLHTWREAGRTRGIEEWAALSAKLAQKLETHGWVDSGLRLGSTSQATWFWGFLHRYKVRGLYTCQLQSKIHMDKTLHPELNALCDRINDAIAASSSSLRPASPGRGRRELHLP